MNLAGDWGLEPWWSLREVGMEALALQTRRFLPEFREGEVVLESRGVMNA